MPNFLHWNALIFLFGLILRDIPPSTCYRFQLDCLYSLVPTSAGGLPLLHPPLLFLPVPVTGVCYTSLLWTCTLNTLTWPDLTWPDRCCKCHTYNESFSKCYYLPVIRLSLWTNHQALQLFCLASVQAEQSVTKCKELICRFKHYFIKTDCCFINIQQQEGRKCFI